MSMSTNTIQVLLIFIIVSSHQLSRRPHHFTAWYYIRINKVGYCAIHSTPVLYNPIIRKLDLHTKCIWTYDFFSFLAFLFSSESINLDSPKSNIQEAFIPICLFVLSPLHRMGGHNNIENTKKTIKEKWIRIQTNTAKLFFMTWS